MQREYGKNSYYDFAAFANEGAADSLARSSLIQSENMYRVCSLIAYGIGLAGKYDIAPFTKFGLIQTTERSYDGELEEVLEIKAAFPYDADSVDLNNAKTLRAPRQYDSALQSGAFSVPFIKAEVIESDYIVITMHVHPWIDFYEKQTRMLRAEALQRDNTLMSKRLDDLDRYKLYHLREPLKFLGQVIANFHVNKAYVGTFEGKPAFQPWSRVEERWLALVELTEKQLPGLCPVCGKVVDRRRSNKGGHPKKTCCNTHSDKLSNLKKKLLKESIENANISSPLSRDELEDLVRMLRWRDIVPNERPLRFKGIELLP